MTEAVKPANDNFDPFSAIGLQAALIVNKLRLQAQLLSIDEKQDEGGASNGETSDSEKKRGPDYGDAVAHGLKRIAAFERRASGIDNRSARKRS